MEAVSPPVARPVARPGRARPRRAGLAVLVLCGAAAAGVQLVDGSGVPYAWDLDTPQPNVVAGKVTYYLDPRGTSDGVTGPLSDLAAARAGIAAWEIGSARIRFAEDASRTANGHVTTDRVNYVGWAGSGLGRLTLAVTFPTRSGRDILDMDVLFNDRDFLWDTRSPGTSGIADIQAIMAHEWGHALGADHVPLRTSTMYFASSTGATAYRSLAADDRALVGSIYPNDTFRLTTGTLRGRVTRAGATDHRAIHVVAVSLVSGEPAASTLTLPDGAYEIRGLPRGVYRLVAAPTIPLDGVLNSFWTEGNTTFLPSILRQSDENPAAVRSVTVKPDEVTVAPAFSVRAATSPFESNESLGTSRLITLGDGVAARLESGGDVDWYAFDATAGQKVSVSVLAWHLGSKADPALSLTTAQGVPLAEQADARSNALFETRPEGPDLDARVAAVTIPSTGRYHVKIRNQAPGTAGDNFYVLFVTQASDAPSAALTSVVADPPRIDADGVSETTLRIVPLKETGDPVPAGATVALVHDGAGTAPAFATDPDGDGTYTAVIRAPPEPGRDRFTVTVTTPDGVATLPDAALVVYLGPPDAAATELTVLPRRIAADGADTATVRVRPRDADGEPLGAGRAVSVQPVGVAGLSAGPATLVGDDVYEVVLKAGTTPGEARLDATVDGVALPALGTLHLGFPLGDVAAQAGADATVMQGLSGVTRKVAGLLRKVVQQTERVADALAGGSEKKAVLRVESTLAKLLKAEKKARGMLPSYGTRDELAAAIRQAAAERLAAAVIVSGKDQKRFDSARDALLEGDAWRGAGVPKKAAARYVRAYRLALKLQP